MATISGHAIADVILNFFGEKSFVNAGASCPVCGASIEWNWTDAANLQLHIQWHDRIGFWEAAP